MPTADLAVFRRHIAAGAETAARYQAALEASWRAALSSAGRRAADQFAELAERVPAGVTAAVPDPHWQVPDQDEIRALRALDDLLTRLRAIDRKRQAVIRNVMEPALSEVGIAFDVKNPLAAGVARNAGANIRDIADTTRRDIMGVIQDSHDQGLSIPKTATAIREHVAEMSKTRAAVIARTEMSGLVNGASLAAARITGAAEWKQWLSAEDDKTRADHETANGQVVPIDAPFLVGGYELQHPGDQTAPASQTANCRCTVIYVEGPEGDSLLAAGGAMPPTPTRARLRPRRPAPAPAVPDTVIAAAQPGTRWRALAVPEGVPTSDGRIFNVGAVEWRDPPVTLMAQFTTGEGHDDARVAGRVDAYTRNDASEIWSEGVFDEGADGVEAARMVGAGTLSRISVDLAEMEFILSIPAQPDEEEPDPSQPIEIQVGPDTQPTLTVTRAVIMGQTITPFSAFPGTYIELLNPSEDGAEPEPVAAGGEWTRQMARLHTDLVIEPVPVTAAAVDNSAGSMIALIPLPDEAGALAVAGGQPADDLHLTVANLPDGGDMATLAAALEPVAASFGVLVGEITGAGAFAVGEDGQPIVALVDAYGLDRLRVQVLDALDAAGAVYSTDHGFLPHITLAYQQDDTAAPDVGELAGRPVTFLGLSVVLGGERSDLVFAGSSGSAKGDMPDRRPPAQATTAAAEPEGLLVDQGRVQVLQSLREAGLASLNECRAALGLGPRPGGDLILPEGVEPTMAVLAAAFETLAQRQPQPPPVHVAAPDVSALGQAIEAFTAGLAAQNTELRALAAAAAQHEPPRSEPTILVLDRGGQKKRVVVERDGDGQTTAYTVEEDA